MDVQFYIFTLNGCNHCMSLMKRLDELEIPYNELEINKKMTNLTKIKKLPKGISASEAMKYVVSGGVTTVDENENESQSDS